MRDGLEQIFNDDSETTLIGSGFRQIIPPSQGSKPKKARTVDDWARDWRGKGAGLARAASWMSSRDLRIRRSPSIPMRAVDMVRSGIDSMFSLVDSSANQYYDGLFEEMQYFDPFVFAKEQNALRSGDYVDVILTNGTFSVNPGAWGFSFPKEGVMVFGLSGGRHSSSFLYKNAQHETGHLLGYQKHHDYCTLYGHDPEGPCLMNFESDGPLCYNCEVAIKSVWSGAIDALQKR